jgi:hypothetical protein
MHDESCSNRVLEDVARNRSRVLISAQHVVEIPLLPQPGAVSELVSRAASLLRELRKTPQVRAILEALDQEVRVIGHQAVRKNREPLLGCCFPEARQSSRYDVVVDEDLRAGQSAKRQGIPIQSDVVEVRQAWWSRHEAATSRKRRARKAGPKDPPYTPAGAGLR